LLAWFFRIPVGLYRVGLAAQLGRSTLLLTTRGRKTRRRRTTPLNYLAEGDVTYVLSGSGPGSDWLRNLQDDPHVQVQVGRRRFGAWAETIVDPAEHRRVLCLWAERSLRTGPPPAVQSLLRRLGFDYAAAVRRHLEEDPPPPMVALRPIPQEREVPSESIPRRRPTDRNGRSETSGVRAAVPPVPVA
jgi:deazaflavin-dependent oxidoreductase (nitroreductase family)